VDAQARQVGCRQQPRALHRDATALLVWRRDVRQKVVDAADQADGVLAAAFPASSDALPARAVLLLAPSVESGWLRELRPARKALEALALPELSQAQRQEPQPP